MDQAEQREIIVFEAALQLTGAQRASYLEQACAGDADLRRRVEDLLGAFERAGGFMRHSAAPERSIGLTPAPTEKPGDKIGRYKLLEQIGEGGCGVVYMAEQEEPVRRKVALKVIKLGMDTKQVITRFEAERQALALMDHPNIAKVLDAGATDAGRPYFVMELVRGIKITEYCDQHQLPTVERLKLFTQVCQAIQHAHQKGIIHRDIKPSNILVADHDGVPVPKVIDFGIAKATTDQRLTDKTLFTAFEQFIGTPAYMSPEQARLSGLDIDTRSDIYSLGVLLYELLTGQTPFDQKELLAAGLDAMRRTIQEKEPPKPSTRLSTMLNAELMSVAQHQRAEPSRLLHTMRGDLDWIVMKALEKDRSRRYETANGLAADVQRHLNNEPAVARPPSKLYEFQKTVRRHKVGFAAAGVVTLALVLGMAGTAWQAVRATRAERLQRQLRQQAEESRDAVKKQEQLARESAEEARLEEQLATKQKLLASRRFYDAQIYLANQALTAGDPAGALGLLETQRPQSGENDLRTFEWYHLWALCNAGLVRDFPNQRNPVRSVAISPDGRTVAAASDNGSIHLWEIDTGREENVLRIEPPVPFDALAFTPDGQTLVSGSWDNHIRVWNVSTGTLRNTFSGDSWRSQCVAVSPNGKTLAAIWDDGRLKLWDLSTGVLQSSLVVSVAPANYVAFSPDGATLATSGGWRAEAIKLWDLTNGSPRLRTTLGAGGLFAFRPDGKIIATCDWQGIKLWDAETGQQKTTINERAGAINDLKWLPNGKGLVTCGSDWTVRLWRSGTNLDGQMTSQIIGVHPDAAFSVAVSPDGSRLVSAASDGSIKLWQVPNKVGQEERQFAYRLKFARGQTNIQMAAVFFSPDGKKLTGITRFGALTKDCKSGADYPPLPEATGRGALTPDGKLLASGSMDGVVKLWDLETGRLVASVKAHDSQIQAMGFSPDGRLLATGATQDPTLKVWNVNDNLKLVWTHSDPDRLSCDALGFSPAGKILAVIYDNSLKVFDSANGRPEQVLQLNKGDLLTYSLVFSPDGRFVATGGIGGVVKIWNWEAGQLFAALPGHASTIYALAFSPDGGTIAAGCEDSTLRLWDTVTGQERMTILPVTKGRIASVAFSPDGNTLAAGYSDGFAAFYRSSLAPEARAFNDHPVKTETSARDDTKLTDLLTSYGQKLLAAEKYAEAESVERQSRDIYSELIRLKTEVIRQKPDDAQAWAGRGDCYLRMGDYTNMAKDYSEAIRLQPDTQRYWHERAFAYESLGEFKQAIADHSQCIKLGDTDADERWRRGYCYESVGDFQDAAADFTRAITLNPGYWQYLEDLARVDSLQFGAERAHADLAEAVRQCSTNGTPDDQVSLAWTLAENGDPRLRDGPVAVALAEKAVASTSRTNRNFLGMLAVAYAEAGQFTNAVDTEREALHGETDPEKVQLRTARLKLFEARMPYHDPMALNNTAWLFATSPQPEVRNGKMAVTLAEEAVSLTSRTNALYVDTLAAAYAETGDFAKAASVEKEAIALLNDVPAKMNFESRWELYQSNRPYREPSEAQPSVP